jgi:hypothetical protein
MANNPDHLLMQRFFASEQVNRFDFLIACSGPQNAKGELAEVLLVRRLHP